ncbi:MAG: ABC transporter permease [Thermoplasmatota archaeon]
MVVEISHGDYEGGSRLIQKRLLRRWGRNSLTVLAIAISFAMLLSLSSVAWGIHLSSQERMKDPPRDLVISSIGFNPSIHNTHEVVRELLDDRTNISSAMPMLTQLGRLAIPPEGSGEMEPMQMVADDFTIPSGTRMENIGSVGILPSLTRDFIDEDGKLSIRSDVLELQGWFSSPSDPFYEANYSDNWTGEVMVDDILMDDYDLKIGDTLYYVDTAGDVRSSLVIVGIVKTSLLGGGLSSELVGGIVLFRLSELQYLTDNHYISTPPGVLKDLSTAIYLNLDHQKKDVDSQREINLMLEEKFPGLSVSSEEIRLYRIEEEAMILELFSISVGTTTFFIGLLFLSSIMLIDVEERKVELSIMRAIGISRKTIFIQVMQDSLILAGLGSLLGIVPGILGSYYIDIYLRDLYGVNVAFSHISPLLIIILLLFLAVNVLIFSMIPAYSGMNQDPRRFF